MFGDSDAPFQASFFTKNRTFVTHCFSGIWKGEKYKALILKYKAHILKYMPCIFYNMPYVFFGVLKRVFIFPVCDDNYGMRTSAKTGMKKQCGLHIPRYATRIIKCTVLTKRQSVWSNT